MLGTQYVFNKYSVEGINSIHVRISARLYPVVIPLFPTTPFLTFPFRMSAGSIIKEEGNEIDNFKGEGRKEGRQERMDKISEANKINFEVLCNLESVNTRGSIMLNKWTFYKKYHLSFRNSAVTSQLRQA